jgi:hypothetical protein
LEGEKEAEREREREAERGRERKREIGRKSGRGEVKPVHNEIALGYECYPQRPKR